MPAYLFTFHAYGSWMPDRKRGYVHRTRGLRRADPRMAAAYRAKQAEPPADFNQAVQQMLLETARDAAVYLGAVVHAVGTDATHLHVLMSWTHERAWASVRRSLRYALTRNLNLNVGSRTWFSEGGSRKRVRGHEHFDYLLLAYLPDHAGVGWRDRGSVAAAEGRDLRREVSVVERFARAKRRRDRRAGRA